MTTAAKKKRLNVFRTPKILEFASGEGVPLSDIAGLVSFAEPTGALGGSAMRERVRDDVSLGAALQGIVTDGARSPHRFIDVAALHDVLCPVGVTCPDSRQKIRLKLQPHRKLVVFGFADPAARGLNLIRDSQ